MISRMTNIEEVVILLSTDPVELFAFAYELRKADVEDKYALRFLYGFVKPSILVDIIMANKWDE